MFPKLSPTAPAGTPSTAHTSAPIDETKLAQRVRRTAEVTNEVPVSGVKNVNSSAKEVSVFLEGKPRFAVNNVNKLPEQTHRKDSSGNRLGGKFTYETIEHSYKKRLIADGTENVVYPVPPGEK